MRNWTPEAVFLRAIFGNARIPRRWYCCGFTVFARSRKAARRAFMQRGIAFCHVTKETQCLKNQ